MLNAREWLEKNYPDKERQKDFETIHIKEKLIGELDLKYFTNRYGIKVYLYPNLDHTQLKIVNQTKNANSKTVQLLDAQQWLDENYPKTGTCLREKEDFGINNNFGKQRDEVARLDISQTNLAGSLDLSDFINLEFLDCDFNYLNELILPKSEKLTKLYCSANKITQLDISNITNLETLSCRKNQLTKLMLPISDKLKILGCSSNQLISLDLSKYINLENLSCDYNELINLILPKSKTLIYLNCQNNQLTKLDCSQHSNLKRLSCLKNRITELILPLTNQLEKIEASDNQLTFFAFLSLNPSILRELYLYNNSLGPTDISVFSCLIGLWKLEIGNRNEWIGADNKGNQFYGSLKALENCTKLEYLSIENTNINTGLEYLFERLQCLNYYSLEDSDFKVKEIERLIKSQSCDNWNSYKKKMIEKRIEEEKKEKYRKEWELELEKEQLEKIKTLTLSESITSIKPEFDLNKWIGEGVSAIVYRGTWSNQNVAIKKFKYSLHTISNKEIKMINEEINLLKNLRNRYIIQYYGLYHNETDLMIIVEFADYGSLDKFIKRNKSNEHDWDFNNKLIVQITKGLQYLHCNKVIHRDLKSMNILITENYVAKIADFGLSEIVNNLDAVQTNSALVGTLRWMAPEIIKARRGMKRPYSVHSDIYALGMVIWEIASKQTKPFKDYDNLGVAEALKAGEREVIPADSPEDIKEVINGCWFEEKIERINLSEIIEKLSSIEESEMIEQIEEIDNSNSTIDISIFS